MCNALASIHSTNQQTNKQVNQRTGKRAQRVNGMPYKYEDVSSDPETAHKNIVTVESASVSPVLLWGERRWRGKYPEARGSGSLTRTVANKSPRRLTPEVALRPSHQGKHKPAADLHTAPLPHPILPCFHAR